MPGWIEQWKLNVPAVVNVRLTCVFLYGAATVPISGGVPAGVGTLNVTVCATDWKTHVTDPPTLIVTVDGTTCWLAVMVMVSVSGMSATFTVPDPFFVTPPDVKDAEIVTGPPSATDVTSPLELTVAIDSSLDDQLAAPNPVIA